MSLTASIVIPAHNASAFVHEAIASAQAQSIRDIEILVIDDGSVDETWDIVTALAAGDPRVVPVRQARQRGPSATRNLGLAQARGRWIAVLDADDLYLPQRIERLVAIGEQRGADLIADNLLERDFDSGRDLGLHFPEAAMAQTEPLSPAVMLQRDMPDLPGRARLGYVKPVLRRDFLSQGQLRFTEDVRAGEDFLFYFECVMHGAKFHLTPEAHYVYRRRKASISNQASAARHYSMANQRMLGLAARRQDRDLLKTLRRRQEMLDYSCFESLIEEGRFLGALRYARCRSPEQLLARLRVAKRAMLPA